MPNDFGIGHFFVLKRLRLVSFYQILFDEINFTNSSLGIGFEK